MFFAFPDDARWNAEQQAVEFGVEIGEYRGVVRVPRRVFQRLLSERPTPERCVEAYYLQPTPFATIADPKLRPRLLAQPRNGRLSVLRLCQSAFDVVAGETTLRDEQWHDEPPVFRAI